MPPQPVHAYAKKVGRALPPDPAEIAHLAVLAADTIETLPPSVTRSLSDLKELDAVLNSSLTLITTKLVKLLELIEDVNATPAQRLSLLKEVAEDAVSFKLGGEDKIRVATGTCETIGLHAKQLDLITSLMTSLMPAHVLDLIPASSTPNGYPHLFPSYGSSTAASLYRPRSDFFPPPVAGPMFGGPMTGTTRSSQNSYAAAMDSIKRYVGEGPLPNPGHVGHSSRRERAPPQPKRAAPAPATAPRARTISQSSQYTGNTTHNLGAALAPELPTHHESPPIDAPSPAPLPMVKKPRRSEKANAVPPLSTTWETGSSGQTPVAPGDYDNGSNADSPVAPGVPARSTKRPRSSQPTVATTGGNGNGGGTSANSPVGERPPSINSSRRRAPKKMSPAPVVRPPSNGPRRRTLPDEADVPIIEDVPEGGAPAIEEAQQRATPTGLSGEDIVPMPPPLALTTVMTATGGPQEDVTMTSQPPTSSGPGDRENEPVYCTCKRVSFGEMIGCDGDDCKTEWFHLSCVGLSDPPKGRWFCPDCTISAPKKRRIA